MADKRYLKIGGALTLAGMLLLAGTALAQNQGGGPGVCPAAPGNQVCTGGPGGTCVVNPSQNPNPQNCPAYGGGKSQRQRGQKRRGAGQQPGQTNPPATNQ